MFVLHCARFGQCSELFVNLCCDISSSTRSLWSHCTHPLANQYALYVDLEQNSEKNLRIEVKERRHTRSVWT